MAGQQFFDVLTMKTKGTKGPTNAVRLAADDTGQLMTSIKGAPYSGFVSGDKWDMCKARAQAFMNGEFTSLMMDLWGANTDVGSGGFAGAPASVLAQKTTQRCGGAQMNLSAAVGTGAYHQQLGIQGTSGQAINVADQIWDPWYVEGGHNVRSITAPAELGFAGLYSLNNPFGDLADGTSIYISIGITMAVSTSFLVVRGYTGTALTTQITTIPIELNTYRRYFLAHDGMSTLFCGRDGVTFPIPVAQGGLPSGGFPMFPQQPSTNGVPFFYGRANGGGTGSFNIDLDYVYCAGVAP